MSGGNSNEVPSGPNPSSVSRTSDNTAEIIHVTSGHIPLAISSTVNECSGNATSTPVVTVPGGVATSTLINMNVSRVKHTSTLLRTGNLPREVLLVGGHPTERRAELFDVRTSTFAFTGALAQPRWSHTATELNDGTVLIAGGVNGGRARAARLPSKWSSCHDPQLGQYGQAGQLLTPRYGHTATAIPGGRV